MVVAFIGGLGMFLLGLRLLVDGLRAAAGSGLRRLLARVIRSPASGAALGATLTALLQSSSATVVATIGLVSAGLMTFPQSLGVILGANVGTTTTGWLVATVGVGLSVKALALPAVAVGAAMGVVGRGRTASIGLAIAGFGLLLFGLDLLRDSMADGLGGFGPDVLPTGAGWEGRLLLVGAGALVTTALQSSSATTAIILLALAGGGIGFEQAVAAAIGANIGTTSTAAFTLFGASAAARRTAMAHIAFNLMIGGAAFGLIGPLARWSTWVVSVWEATPGPLAVAAFHTSINLAGALVLLPLVPWLAKVLVAVVPQHRDDLSRRLDRTVSTIGPIAEEALRRTSLAIVARIAEGCLAAFRGDESLASVRSAEVREGLRAAAAFAGRIESGRASEEDRAEHAANLHLLDHARRLLESVGDGERRRLMAASPSLAPQRSALAKACEIASRWENATPLDADAACLEAAAAELAALRKAYRVRRLGEAAETTEDPEMVLAELDASRAMDALAYHLHRAASWGSGRRSPRGAPRERVRSDSDRVGPGIGTPPTGSEGA